MTSAALHRTAERHPWLDTLTADPLKGFGDLLAGYASIYPYARADTPDAARMLFTGLHADDPAWDALTQGALQWLDRARRSSPPDTRPVMQNQVRMVIEALEIIAVLELVGAATPLRQEYHRWAAWTGRLVLSPARDARAAYWRLLARTQGTVARTVVNPDSLAPLWIRLCREVGQRALPDRYLQIALLGLRRLPNAIQRGDTPWIAGIAAWALARNPSDADFMAAWGPLKHLYPTGRPGLRKQVINVLGQKPYRDAGIEPPGWWAADPDVSRGQARLPPRTLEPPSFDDVKKALAGIKPDISFVNAKLQVDPLVEEFRVYTQRIGDSYFLVRSFHRIGVALISIGDDARVERGHYAQDLAIEILQYEPANLFAWSLWRDALATAGAVEAARAVGWEMVKRFPEDPVPRNLLSDLLAKEIGAYDEAETVARETILLFPDNTFARNQLAELLLAQDRTPEARDVVAAAIAMGAADAATYAILARMRAGDGDREGAQDAVEHGLRRHPHDVVLKDFRTKLTRGADLPLVSTAYRQVARRRDGDPIEATQDEVLRSGCLRALRDRLDTDDSARDAVRAILDEDPNLAYARLLAARHRLWDAKSQVLPTVAEAFEAALADGDRARLEALAKTAPRLEALILLARALFGDTQAAQEIVRRLRGVTKETPDQGTRILGLRLKLVINGIDAGGDPLETIQGHRDLVRQTLYDANEALAAEAFLAA